MTKSLITIILVTTLLSACVSEYQPAPPIISDPSNVKLAEAADSVNRSIETLAGIQKAEASRYQKKLPNFSGYNLGTEIAIDWTGPIGPLVKKIAFISNYRYRQLGNPPSIPIIIALHKDDSALTTILRDIDYQAGTKADIFVYPQSRIIELRYKHLTS